MWAATITLIFLCLTLWALWRKKKLNTFKSLNISGPKPGFLFGNFWELLHKGQQICFKEWIEKYGRVFGYYYGLTPVLVVADPDLLRIIQLKEFQKFINRPKLFDVGSSSKDYNKHNLINAEGKKWKEMRSIVTPTFTVSKLKMMNPIMNQAVDELLDAVERESAKGKPFNIYGLYQNLTMDVIARTSLGFHSTAQEKNDEPFVKLARLILSFEIGYLSMVTYSFPELTSVFSLMRRMIMSFYNKGKHPRGEIQDRTLAVIQKRRKDPNSRRRDLLQLLMDAHSAGETVNDSQLTTGENDDATQNGTSKTSSTTGKKLSDEEVLQNATLFLLAGYETTSTALAFATHFLSYHQDVQNKIREEMKSLFSEGEDLTYETIQKLQCLDGVLFESLRIYPPIIYFVNRQTTEDFMLNDVHIPKNMAIQVPIYNLHHDPTLWEEPEKFNPDRWTPAEKAKHHPMAFQAFGAGPRNCIGMRFALMEGKLALAKLLNKYKFLPKPGTREEDLELSQTVVTLRPKKGIMVEVEKV